MMTMFTRVVRFRASGPQLRPGRADRDLQDAPRRSVLWRVRDVAVENVGTPMFLVPNVSGKLPDRGQRRKSGTRPILTSFRDPSPCRANRFGSEV